MIHEIPVYTHPYLQLRVLSFTNQLRQLNELHFHREYELLYLQEGQIRCYNSQLEVIANQGDILFVNKNVPHADESLLESSKYLLLLFREKEEVSAEIPEVLSFLEQTASPFHVFWASDPLYPLLKEHMLHLHTYRDNPEAQDHYAILSHLYGVLSILFQRSLIGETDPYFHSKLWGRLLPVFTYIDQHYREHLTPQILADLLLVNKSYFCRLFKSFLGVTSLEYINFVRISKSIAKLPSEQSLSEIADAVGFSSLAHYDKTFRRFHHCSPSAYRKILTSM